MIEMRHDERIARLVQHAKQAEAICAARDADDDREVRREEGFSIIHGVIRRRMSHGSRRLSGFTQVKQKESAKINQIRLIRVLC